MYGISGYKSGGGTTATASAEEQSGSKRSEIPPSSQDSCCVSTGWPVPLRQFLPSLLSFAPSHMWASEKEAKHSSCTVAMHPCEAPRLRRYHWCTAKELYIRFPRAWVKAFWLLTGEQETARHHLTVFVLSNTFCLLRVGMETKSALVF